MAQSCYGRKKSFCLFTFFSTFYTVCRRKLSGGNQMMGLCGEKGYLSLVAHLNNYGVVVSRPYQFPLRMVPFF